jgi:hypothetical protein
MIIVVKLQTLHGMITQQLKNLIYYLMKGIQMTTIINKYIGITNPITGDGISEKEYNLILESWKYSNCVNGIHLFDEVWSDNNHYLSCDACGMEVHIEKVVVPDGKEDVIK